LKRFIEFYDIKNKNNRHIDISKIYMIEEATEISIGWKSKIYIDTANTENSLLVKDAVEEIMALMGLIQPVVDNKKKKPANRGVIKLPV